MSEQLTIRKTFEAGEPWYEFSDLVPKKELALRIQGAEEACLTVHTALYEAVAEKRAVVFDDEHEHTDGVAKFVSLPDRDSKPSYFRWDPTHAATDIGLRGVNTEFEGVANPVTIIHADKAAVSDFIERGAPRELIEAVDAVGLLNAFVVAHVVRPMLRQIANEYCEDQNTYIEKFLPKGKRARTLTRVILYHTLAKNGGRPIGSDGAQLLIKEHNDQSSFTVDSMQSGPGLEYMVDGKWEAAHSGIACFRGIADDGMQEQMKPTTHRAKYDRDVLEAANLNMQSRGIGRLAMPTFVSLSGENVRVVPPSSPQTHPTRATAIGC